MIDRKGCSGWDGFAPVWFIVTTSIFLQVFFPYYFFSFFQTSFQNVCMMNITCTKLTKTINSLKLEHAADRKMVQIT